MNRGPFMSTVARPSRSCLSRCDALRGKSETLLLRPGTRLFQAIATKPSLSCQLMSASGIDDGVFWRMRVCQDIAE